MTRSAIARYPGVIHPRAGEGVGIVMAGLTGQQSREVVRRFAHDTQRLAIMAG
jgi:hypothetical protein